VNVVALVLAGDRGARWSAKAPEALLSVCGEALLSRAVRGLLDSGYVRHVVVVSAPAALAGVDCDLEPWAAAVQVVPEGADLAQSMRRAIAEAMRAVPDAGAILVHDPARAFAPASMIRAVVRAVEQGARVAVPVLPVPDTIKEVDAMGDISATVDRSRLRIVQTPQGFAPDVLRAACESPGADTDDVLRMVAGLHEPMATVAGHPHAMRISTQYDAVVAKAILAEPAIGGRS
jgi:2-C-methyl-D-erythritol 4-phosphate cytidylyltransferase